MYLWQRINASWLANDSEREKFVRSVAERVFNRSIEPLEIAHLVAVPDGSLVHVDAPAEDEIKVDSYSREQGVRMIRGFHRDEKGLRVWHYRMRVSPTGAGKGLEVFTTTVERYRTAGVQRIETIPARDDREDPEYFQNGYRVWASFGFCLVFEPEILAKLEGTPFEGAKNTHELFAIDGGDVWWFVNGESSYGVFEVDENSRHNRILEGYRAIKLGDHNARAR